MEVQLDRAEEAAVWEGVGWSIRQELAAKKSLGRE